MTDKPPPNLIWETALDWLLLIQENPDDPELNARLNHWRASAPEHDAAYRKALKVWSLSGEALSLPVATEPAPMPMPTALRPPTTLSRRKRALVGAAVAASALLMWGPTEHSKRYHPTSLPVVNSFKVALKTRPTRSTSLASRGPTSAGRWRPRRHQPVRACAGSGAREDVRPSALVLALAL